MIFNQPENFHIQRVHGFQQLQSTAFQAPVNALYWPRVLPGDFAEVVRKIGPGEGILTLDEDFLQSLPVSPQGRIAINIMLGDMHLLRNHDLDPVLNCIYAYPRDDDSAPIATDVFSFHVDSATVEADTWLCTYYGASSEGLANEAAIKKVDIPEIRQALLEIFGGEDNDEFYSYLHENYMDLHYAAMPEAKPYSFGLGNMWRIATEYPESPVPPCIHRAPLPSPNATPRLLLIS